MPTTPITSASSGDNTVVSAVAGYAIRVLRFMITFSAAVNAKWKSGAGTDVTGLFYGIGTGPPAVGDAAPGYLVRGLFMTNKGDALVLNLSGAVAVGGYVVWEQASQ